LPQALQRIVEEGGHIVIILLAADEGCPLMQLLPLMKQLRKPSLPEVFFNQPTSAISSFTSFTSTKVQILTLALVGDFQPADCDSQRLKGPACV